VLGGTPFTSGAETFFNEFRRTALDRCLLPDQRLRIVASDLDGRSDLRGALRAAQEELPTTFAPLHSIVELLRVAA
jgi:hypothetical protein